MNKIILLFTLYALTLSSCTNPVDKNELETQNENLINENQIKQSKIDEQERQINQLEDRLNKLEETQKSEPVINTPNSYNEDYSNYSGQYYFVVLEVTEDHIVEKQNLYYTTQVNQLNNYNDNVKYRLLDEVVTNYKKSPSGMAYKGNVKKRNIYLFDSYEQASKAREKYIMN